MINPVAPSTNILNYDIEANASWVLTDPCIKKANAVAATVIAIGATLTTAGALIVGDPTLSGGGGALITAGVLFIIAGLAFGSCMVSDVKKRHQIGKQLEKGRDEAVQNFEKASQRKIVYLNDSTPMICGMPDDIWRLIIQQLPKNDALNLTLVNKHFCHLISASSTWEKVVEEEKLDEDEVWNIFLKKEFSNDVQWKELVKDRWLKFSEEKKELGEEERWNEFLKKEFSHPSYQTRQLYSKFNEVTTHFLDHKKFNREIAKF